MMMDGGHAEHTLAREFERDHLNNHRQGLDNEEAADNDENDLVFHGNGNRADEAADGERSGVAHKDLCRRRIEPQKAKTCANESTANDSQLARARHKINAEIIGENRIAGDPGDNGECSRCNHRGHDCQTIEPIGQIDRIAGGDDDERRKKQEEPAQIEEIAIDERHSQTRGGRRAIDHHDQAGDKGDESLAGQTCLARKALVTLFRDFQIIVIETDQAKAGRNQQHDPDIMIAQVRPEKGRDDEA